MMKAIAAVLAIAALPVSAHAMSVAAHATVSAHAAVAPHVSVAHEAVVPHESVSERVTPSGERGSSERRLTMPVFVYGATGAHATACPEPYTSYDDCRRDD